jgi:hypothetical protein
MPSKLVVGACAGCTRTLRHTASHLSFFVVKRSPLELGWRHTFSKVSECSAYCFSPTPILISHERAESNMPPRPTNASTRASATQAEELRLARIASETSEIQILFDARSEAYVKCTTSLRAFRRAQKRLEDSEATLERLTPPEKRSSSFRQTAARSETTSQSEEMRQARATVTDHLVRAFSLATERDQAYQKYYATFAAIKSRAEAAGLMDLLPLSFVWPLSKSSPHLG